MADVTHNDPVVTESKLTEFYNDIKPFLGCPAYLTSEGNAEYYSTDEKVIGRWIDGKPLYKKVWSVNISLGTAAYRYNISEIAEMDSIISCKGIAVPNTSSYPVLSDGDMYFMVEVDKTQNQIMIKQTMTTSTTLYTLKYIIVQYTKTTDSAATTIQEDPNEYSTDEKIIGKWIDGKPLYQKTFQFDNMIIDGTQQNFGSLSGLNIGSYAEVVRSTLNEDNYWTNPGILCVWVRVPQNNFGVRMVDGISRHGSLYFTIQYTKTTD